MNFRLSLFKLIPLVALVTAIFTPIKMVEAAGDSAVIDSAAEKSEVQNSSKESNPTAETSSDLFDSTFGKLGITGESDYATESDHSAEGDHSTEGDYAAEGDHSTEGDYAAEGDHSAEGDYAAEGDHSAEGDHAAAGGHETVAAGGGEAADDHGGGDHGSGHYIPGEAREFMSPEGRQIEFFTILSIIGLTIAIPEMIKSNRDEEPAGYSHENDHKQEAEATNQAQSETRGMTVISKETNGMDFIAESSTDAEDKDDKGQKVA